MTQKKERYNVPERNDVRVKLVQLAQLLAKGMSVRRAIKEVGVSPTTYTKYKDFVWGLVQSFNPKAARIVREGDTVKAEVVEPDEELEEEIDEAKKDFEQFKEKTKKLLKDSGDIPPFESTQLNAFSQIETLATQLDQALEAIGKFEQRLAQIAQKLSKRYGYGGLAEFGAMSGPPVTPPPENVTVQQAPSSTEEELEELRGVPQELRELVMMQKAVDKYKALLEMMRTRLGELAEKMGFKLIPEYKALPKQDKEKMLKELAEELGFELEPKLIPKEKALELYRKAKEEARKEISIATEEKKIDAITGILKEIIRGGFSLVGKLLTGQKVSPREIAEAEEKVGRFLETVGEIIEEEEGEEEGEESGETTRKEESEEETESLFVSVSKGGE